MSSKRALLVGNSKYSDGAFSELPSCIVDVWQFKQVLEEPAIGGFDDVRIVTDTPAEGLRYEIAEFFGQAEPDDLALLYLTGHGLRLTRTTGEFFFVAGDTDHQMIEETAVGASFVNEQIELCRAAQKVAILDCCKSGGFALGFTTRDSKAVDPAPLTSRGVYVLASSGAAEDSFAGAEGRPSVFTEEIIEGLRTGRADNDGDGNVSVDDLFFHVGDRLRNRPAATRQTPVASALGVTDRIILARSAAGRALPLLPLPTGFQREHVKSAPAESNTDWPGLIDYYLACLTTDATKFPLLTRRDVVVVPGAEQVLCGDDSYDDVRAIALPPEAKRLIDQEDHDLWYGYPTVVLLKDSAGKPLRVPGLAPLMIQQLEAEQGRVTAVGPARPNPQLLSRLLGEEEAAAFADTYRPTWRRGMHRELAKDLRHHLRELGIECVDEIRPDQLAPGVDVATPMEGARNCAVVFTLPRGEAMIRQLQDDLRDVKDKAPRITDTALATLLDSPLPIPESPWDLVAPLPLNESQLEVVTSAMRERITVATGPPGTGKSQVVADTIATAVCSGQRVLFASNNNQAVDEVWHRLEAVMPGTLIRSGSKKVRESAEKPSLNRLLTLRPSVNTATATAALSHAGRTLETMRAQMGEVAALERDLLEVGQAREEAAAKLGAAPSELPGGWEWWWWKAQKVSRTRLLGGWRRARLFRRANLGVPATVESCEALAMYAQTQVDWRDLIGRLRRLPSAETLVDDHDDQWKTVAEAARTRLQAEVTASAARGRHAITELLQTDGQGWTKLRNLLPYVRGWAVTNQSARRLPPDPGLFDLVIIDEASQCSIAGVLPLLFRAKRALIIGDPMQLPHVSNLDPAQEARHAEKSDLHPAWLDGRHLTYHRYSAYHALAMAAGRVMMLDEHYRCHPDIAGISNRLFYADRLTVLVDVHRQRRVASAAIGWQNVRGQAQPGPFGSWINAAEAKHAVDLARSLAAGDPDLTVGILTPFRGQKELLVRLLGRDTRIRAGTAHTFQGGECDVIVMSLVATENIKKSTVNWLNAKPNLWNVAITRARAHLIVVGDRDYWTGCGNVVGELLSSSPPDDDQPLDPLTGRLYAHLTGRHSVPVQLRVRLDGYIADALYDHDRLAVHLDRGAQDGDPARHLRVAHTRARLLSDQAAGRSGVRLPAWQLYEQTVP
ncbi:hypothetical protein FDA94_38275 [Herbidospora galbida]|uniref:Caspase family p20 domain-containing protein n=1 Tax=Herbidospora galbida TaxID=2575442 RepID=A0A4U3LPZ3_9ACTN|nr:AAA domain-containing protein [Herbidospora galbida]TKK77194.1 hypothetical protein FDA94_38275 [Herbidospora galbida]